MTSFNSNEGDGESLCIEWLFYNEIDSSSDLIPSGIANYILVHIDIHDAVSINIQGLIPKVATLFLKGIGASQPVALFLSRVILRLLFRFVVDHNYLN